MTKQCPVPGRTITGPGAGRGRGPRPARGAVSCQKTFVALNGRAPNAASRTSGVVAGRGSRPPSPGPGGKVWPSGVRNLNSAAETRAGRHSVQRFRDGPARVSFSVPLPAGPRQRPKPALGQGPGRSRIGPAREDRGSARTPAGSHRPSHGRGAAVRGGPTARNPHAVPAGTKNWRGPRQGFGILRPHARGRRGPRWPDS